MPRYFFTSLANRPMTLSKIVIRFQVCSFQSGKAVGIYAATDPSEIAVLDDAVRGKRGVKEIGAEEFEALKKKATQTPPSSNSNVSKPRVVRIPTLPEAAIEQRAGVASADLPGGGRLKAGENILSGPNPGAPPSIKSLIHVERVNPPKPFGASDQKVAKASKRADRAKVRVARRATDTA